MGRVATRAGALHDQRPFEFGDGRQQGRERPTRAAGGVPQRVAQRLERCASFVDAVKQILPRGAVVTGAPRETLALGKAKQL
jgi:hypothetical protein